MLPSLLHFCPNVNAIALLCSNTSFQIPPEFRTTLLEIEEGEGTSSDEEKEFEAVTPERGPDAISPHTDLIQMTTPNSNKKHTQLHVHTLVLAEVDGELEMEDVAPPPCDPAEQLGVSAADSLVNGAEAQVEGSQEMDFAPPLPEDRPPSPPPLPSSPPPPPMLLPPPPPPPFQVIPHVSSVTLINFGAITYLYSIYEFHCID